MVKIKIDPDSRQDIKTTIRENDRSLDALNRFKRLTGETSNSKAYKIGLEIALSYIEPISRKLEVKFKLRKEKYHPFPGSNP